MLRKTILIASLLALVGLAILSWLIYQASPGPDDQVILGLTLGQFGSEKGVAFLSGRRMDCVPQAEPPYSTTCNVTIAGQPLTIQAYRNGPGHLMQLSGGCEATYAGQAWPCEISSRHVHVHWFARISDPLGLSGNQMAQLRRRYFFENLAEEPILFGTIALPVVAALAVLAGLLAWQRPFSKQKWAATIALSLLTFVATFAFALNLTNGFWD